MTRRRTSGKANQQKSAPGRLRIVAGNWRSRVLPVADVDGLRPTPDRVRETLFNWLGPGIHGKRCLDLFAGTGALGLEALSRGAAEVVFVEKSSRAAKALRKNLDTLAADGGALIEGDAYRWLSDDVADRFDIVFLDPPFAEADYTDLCRLLAEREVVKPGGSVYVEMPRDAATLELPAGWRQTKQKTAGAVRFALLEVKKNEESECQ